MYKRKTITDLSSPSTNFSQDSSIPGFCWRRFWVIEDLAPQVSFALFHYQYHSGDALFLEKGCAIKLYYVTMVQFSDRDNLKKHAMDIRLMKIWFI